MADLSNLKAELADAVEAAEKVVAVVEKFDEFLPASIRNAVVELDKFLSVVDAVLSA